MDRDYLESEVQRVRERVHDLSGRVKALELRDEQVSSAIERLSNNVAYVGDQVRELAKKDELEEAIASAVKAERLAAQREERDHWLKGMALPYKTLVYVGAGFGAATVIANAIRSLFFGG